MKGWPWVAAVLLAGVAGAQQAPTVPVAGDKRAAARGEPVHALLELAELAARRGDFAAAAEPLRRAVALAPNSERVLHTYARITMAAGAPGRALAALQPLARMHPTVVEYPYLAGVVWLLLGDPVEAEAGLERALELEPRRVLTLAALGIALNEQQRYADAKNVLEQARTLAADEPDVLAELAAAAAGLGEHALAESRAKEALERAPRHPRAQLVLGMVYMQREHYAEARRWLEGALAADPGLVKAHYQLSLACARLGDRECTTREVERYREAQRALTEELEALPSLTLEDLPAGNRRSSRP